MSTKIEWCDETINPIVGCKKKSEGCKNCYAEKMAWRLKNIGIKKYQTVVNENGWTGNIGIDLNAFYKLPKYKSKKVFVCSMGDIFHKDVTDDQINKVITKMVHPMGGASHHTYMLLTKHPERIPEEKYEYFKEWKNIWLGVTGENQEMTDKRLKILSKIPAIIKFISIEPILESIDITHYLHNDRIDWVICGPETGTKKRPFNHNWARFLRDQCRTANIPFFFKKHDDPDTPEDLRIKEFPK